MTYPLWVRIPIAVVLPGAIVLGLVAGLRMELAKPKEPHRDAAALDEENGEAS